MRENDNSGYKSALKATAIFGGVQVFNILVKLIKSKIIAILMGASGFGILSLYTTLSEMLSSATNLGLQSSAVRDYSIASASGDHIALANKRLAIRRWVAVTSLLGALVTMIGANYFSLWMFNNDDYTNGIRLLSCVVLLMGVYNGQYSYLQGIRKIKALAKANIVGAIISLLLSVPFFLLLKENGIIWSIIITAIVTTIISSYYCSKYKTPSVTQNIKQSFLSGINTVKLGIAMSIGMLSGTIVAFLIKSIIVRYGGIEDVGYYQAGCTINITYLGLVFTAIAKDYFPRLSAMKDLEMMKKTANQQAEIAILLLAPMIIIMIVFLKPIISILFTNDFYVVTPMLQLMLLGSLVKAGSWDLSYVFLAKGSSKLFLFSELGVYIVVVPIYIFLYCQFGLIGLGYSYLLHQILSFVWVAFTAEFSYKIHYSADFWKLFLAFAFMITIYLILKPLVIAWSIGLDVVTLIILLFYAYNEFSKRVSIKKLIQKQK